MPDKDPVAGISKVVGLLVAVLTVLSIIGGLIWNLSSKLTIIQMTQVMHDQQIQANSMGIKTLNSKREQGDDNFTKLIEIMARVHDRGSN